MVMSLKNIQTQMNLGKTDAVSLVKQAVEKNTQYKSKNAIGVISPLAISQALLHIGHKFYDTESI